MKRHGLILYCPRIRTETSKLQGRKFNQSAVKNLLTITIAVRGYTIYELSFARGLQTIFVRFSCQKWSVEAYFQQRLRMDHVCLITDNRLDINTVIKHHEIVLCVTRKRQFIAEGNLLPETVEESYEFLSFLLALNV